LRQKGVEMAMMRSGTAEVQFREFIQDPAYKPLLQPVLQRHPDADQDETHLFEAIGEDLDSEQEVVREEAFWALKPLIPEIDEDLYVRKKSQENIIDHLIQEFVKEHRFTTKKGKDPRPLVKKIINNWRIDGQKRENRLISLDKPLVAGEEETTLRSSLRYPRSFEAIVEAKLLAEQILAKLELTKNEKFVIDAEINDMPTREIAEKLGVTENAVAHLKYRARQKIRLHQEYLRSLDATLYCHDVLYKMAMISQRSCQYQKTYLKN
jgi:DNA-directed RNA polymerase specialized sigma24 family protein